MSKNKRKKQNDGKSSPNMRADVATIIEDEFGNYRIRAGRLSGNFLARAFPKAGSNSQGLIAEASGASEAEAIEALKEILRIRSVQRTEERRWETRSEVSVPSKDEFIEALRQTNLTSAQRSMLKAHAIAGESGMTLAALKKAAGYQSEETALKALKRTGSLVADFLGVDVRANTEKQPQDAREVLGYFVDADIEAGVDTPLIWVMHDELRDAVRATL